MAQPLAPRLEEITQLPCTRLIHHISKNEIVQIHIEFKRCVAGRAQHQSAHCF